jgi:DNA-binding MarR family transcriptional regulator
MGVGGASDPDDPMLPARLRLAVGRLNRRIRVDSAAVLPPLQTSVLVTLEEHEPLRLSELARREAVTPPTMSRVLAALDDAGLLVRTPDPQDARSALVELSGEGRSMIERLRTERTALLAERLERLPEEQRDALAAALPALEALVTLPSE